MKQSLFFSFFCCVVLFLVSCTSDQEPNVIVHASKPITFSVEVATTIEQQRSGLSNRTALVEDLGMLFIFPQSQETYFWMKDTYIPLDILFIDENLSIVSLKENAVPCTVVCPLYSSGQPVKYVLEINGGLAHKYGIRVGQTVELHLTAS